MLLYFFDCAKRNVGNGIGQAKNAEAGVGGTNSFFSKLDLFFYLISVCCSFWDLVEVGLICII